jgi:hemerythrin-like domain-containing protein
MSSNAKMPQLVSTPAVGFDQPFDMLDACHERVDRTLTLLQRLVTHVTTQGHDASSRSAATDVMRYFDLAAPHHHLDEERHVFPPLLASGRSEWVDAINTLLQDHQDLQQQWAELRLTLQAWAVADAEHAPASAQMHQAVKTYCARYAQHMLLEESVAYPAARGLIDEPDALQAMGAEMRARRQQ